MNIPEYRCSTERSLGNFWHRNPATLVKLPMFETAVTSRLHTRERKHSIVHIKSRAKLCMSCVIMVMPEGNSQDGEIEVLCCPHESLALNVGKAGRTCSQLLVEILTQTGGNLGSRRKLQLFGSACSLPTVPVLCWKRALVAIQCMS